MSTHPNEDAPNADLLHKVETGAHVAEKVAESEGLRENLAGAVFKVRESALFTPMKMAWDLLPARAQRLMLSEHTGAGAFLLKYFPQFHPEAYFLPGQLLAGFIKCGLLDFKMNEEETKEMEAALGVDAGDAQKQAYWNEKQEAIIAGIITPGEGIPELLGSKPAQALAAVEPELEPLILIGKAGGKVAEARDGFFESVRARAHELSVEAAKGKEVEAEERREHDAVAADLKPQVDIPTANGTTHFETEHQEAA